MASASASASTAAAAAESAGITTVEQAKQHALKLLDETFRIRSTLGDGETRCELTHIETGKKLVTPRNQTELSQWKETVLMPLAPEWIRQYSHTRGVSHAKDAVIQQGIAFAISAWCMNSFSKDWLYAHAKQTKKEESIAKPIQPGGMDAALDKFSVRATDVDWPDVNEYIRNETIGSHSPVPVRVVTNIRTESAAAPAAAVLPLPPPPALENHESSLLASLLSTAPESSDTAAPPPPPPPQAAQIDNKGEPKTHESSEAAPVSTTTPMETDAPAVPAAAAVVSVVLPNEADAYHAKENDSKNSTRDILADMIASSARLADANDEDESESAKGAGSLPAAAAASSSSSSDPIGDLESVPVMADADENPIVLRARRPRELTEDIYARESAGCTADEERNVMNSFFGNKWKQLAKFRKDPIGFAILQQREAQEFEKEIAKSGERDFQFGTLRKKMLDASGDQQQQDVSLDEAEEHKRRVKQANDRLREAVDRASAEAAARGEPLTEEDRRADVVVLGDDDSDEEEEDESSDADATGSDKEEEEEELESSGHEEDSSTSSSSSSAKKRKRPSASQAKLQVALREIMPKIDRVRQGLTLSSAASSSLPMIKSDKKKKTKKTTTTNSKPAKKQRAQESSESRGSTDAKKLLRQRTVKENSEHRKNVRVVIELLADHLVLHAPDSKLSKIIRSDIDPETFTAEQHKNANLYHAYAQYNKNNGPANSNLLFRTCIGYFQSLGKQNTANERLLSILSRVSDHDMRVLKTERIATDERTRRRPPVHYHCYLSLESSPNSAVESMIVLDEHTKIPLNKQMFKLVSDFHFGTHFSRYVEQAYATFLNENKNLDPRSTETAKLFCNTSAVKQLAERWVSVFRLFESLA